MKTRSILISLNVVLILAVAAIGAMAWSMTGLVVMIIASLLLLLIPIPGKG